VNRRTDGPVAVPAARDGHDDGAYATDDDTMVQRRGDAPAAVPAADTRYADEPSTAERREVDTDGDGYDDGSSRGFFGRRRNRRTEYSGTPTAPQPEPAPRRTDDLD